ncbi:hypothetical protein L2E82_29678 [Cichorium intybus]|uniref:Uncharacterized protein n=1 Tax=Cichorium intybus TaxID=13427 RepID=A0ACB9CY95_CICIN|nr:hypothetical protein L2E82_29678 [Cichorium intybus]
MLTPLFLASSDSLPNDSIRDGNVNRGGLPFNKDRLSFFQLKMTTEVDLLGINIFSLSYREEPVSHIVALPSPNSILKGHYVLEGSQGTPFAGGYYYGKIKFPAGTNDFLNSILILIEIENEHFTFCAVTLDWFHGPGTTVLEHK